MEERRLYSDNFSFKRLKKRRNRRRPFSRRKIIGSSGFAECLPVFILNLSVILKASERRLTPALSKDDRTTSSQQISVKMLFRLFASDLFGITDKTKSIC